MIKEFTFDVDTFSDLHKDAFGFRPRGHEFYEASDERKQKIWDYVCREADAEMIRYQEMEREAITEFERKIAVALSYGAADRSAAIRWIVEAEGVESWEDPQYICFLFGIPYEMASVFSVLKEN